MTDKKELKRLIFSFGNYQLTEKVEAKDEGVNTIGNIDSIKVGDIMKFPSQKKIYRNPRVIFTYISPPGDLVAHPELLQQIKKRNWNSEPKLNNKENQRSQVKLSSELITTVNSSPKKQIESLKRIPSSQLISEKSIRYQANSRASTPNKKRKMSVYCNTRSSLKNYNPELSQSPQIKNDKIIDDFFKTKYFEELVINYKK